MARLQNIENALREINEAVFQNLCDSYLALQNPNYRAFSRSGSVTGKQKTRIGTPDSFLLLPDGRYMFVEHSTNVTSGVKKLEEDIEKCLDEGKTNIPVNQISEIVLCLNFNLKLDEVDALKEMLKDTRIRLTIEMLDSISVQLHLQHKNLVHEYLGLPMDTGQIVSLEQFVEIYQNASSGVATPLNNTFIERKEEFKQLEQAMTSSDFVIVTGAPGVGKTRLCLEVINQFVSDNQSFTGYALANKHTELLEDMYQYFDNAGNAILLVDDANRLDRLNQVTEFFRSREQGTFKLVLTVRDYAYHHVGLLCSDLSLQTIPIQKLDDSHIQKIIEAEPFNIGNAAYQKPIKQIADGNPRLAIMAARIGVEKQSISVYYDVSDLFDAYYTTFAKDDELFSNKLTIKILGLISFFYTLPLDQKDVLESILNRFNIPYPEFMDLIDRLDQLELVEINFEHIKVPEQNLSMYFFYRAFVKESELSFSILLNTYFDSHKSRFRETVIYANNTFGQEKVMKKLVPELKEYWKLIRDNDEKARSFLVTFWFYLQDETLEYIQDFIEKMPDDNAVEYTVSYGVNDFSYNRDFILDLLTNFFHYHSFLPDPLELAFEYARKAPPKLAELLYHIKENLTFSYDDFDQDIKRQNILFNYLIKGIRADDKLLIAAFYALTPKFLSFRFQNVSGAGKNSISIQTITIPSGFSPIEKFRTRLWEVVEEYFSENHQKTLDLLKSYASPSPGTVREVMEFELPLIVQIIKNHLSPDNFDHCLYVHDQLRWWRRNEIETDHLAPLSQKFTNDLYETFLVLDWDRFRDKESFEFDDFEEYEKKKENQIRQHFHFSSKEEVRVFYKDFIYLKDKSKNDWAYNNVLAIIIDQTFTYNLDVGHFILQLIIEEHNQIGFSPRMLFKNVLTKNSEYTVRLWALICSNEFQNRFEWQLAYFYDVPDVLIDSSYTLLIVNAIEGMTGYSSIHFENLERYQQLDNGFFQKVLEAVYEKNKKEGSFISLWGDVYTKYFDELGNDIDIIKESYLQQSSYQNFFDRRDGGLVEILKRDKSFLIDFIASLYDKGANKFQDDRSLGEIWQIDGIDKVIVECFDLIKKVYMYFGILDHPANMFFKRVDEKYKRATDEFIFSYIENNQGEPDKMNLILDVIRNSKKELFDKVLGLYLSLNQAVDDFKKIHWIGTGGTYSGETIVGDIRAAKWRKVLSVVDELDQGIKARRVKQYIKEQIEAELRWGDVERKRRFLGTD